MDLAGQRKFDPPAYPGIQNHCLGEMFKSIVKEFCLGYLLTQGGCPIMTVLKDGCIAPQLLKAKLVCRMSSKNAVLYTFHPIQWLQRIRKFSKKQILIRRNEAVIIHLTYTHICSIKIGISTQMDFFRNTVFNVVAFLIFRSI